MAFIFPRIAHSANEVSPSFSLQGALTNAAGTTAITDTNVSFKVDIYNPAANCLLYEESQSGINLSTTSGVFNLQIGSAVGDAKRVAGQDPGLTMATILTNAAVVRGAGANCAGGYTSSAADGRLVRITITSGSLGTVTLSPDLVLSSTPQAVVAQSLQGKSSSQLIQVTANITQANAATLTGAGDASTLHTHDSLYVKLGTGGAQNIGTGSFYTTGNVGIGTSATTANTELKVLATSNANKGVVIQGAAAQAANYFEIDNSASTALLAVNNAGAISTGTWNGTAITVPYGGTGLSSGTSGGIPYFSSSTTMASSGALTQYQVLLGGGAGASPTVVAGTGTSGQLLTSNGAAAPTWVSGVPFSAIKAAVANLTLDHTLFDQTWNWTTATTQNLLTMAANTLTTGSILSITSSNGTVNSTNGLLNVVNSGASTSGTVARIQSNSTAGSGLTLLASGNVGIGTASPAAQLDIAYTNTQAAGNVYGLQITPTLNQGGSAANIDLRLSRTQTSLGSGVQMIVDAQVNGVSKFNIDRDGNFTIAGRAANISTGDKLLFGNTTSAGWVGMVGGDSSTGGCDSIVMGDHLYGNGDVDCFNSPGGGRGITAGRYNATGLSHVVLEVGNGSGAGAKANAFTILNTGNVGIATTTPSYPLHVVGTAGLSTGTAWVNASDIRLKDIQGDYEYGLEEVAKLHTVRFNYKKGNPLHLPSDKPMTGFIAQEVQKLIPDAVHKNDNGFLELNVDPIHWAVVNSIKQLYKKILDYKKEDIALEEELLHLQAERAPMIAFLCKRNPAASYCRK